MTRVDVINLYFFLNIRNHPDYERHKQTMSEFLELLITHPIAGSLAMKDLRGSIREKDNNRGLSESSDRPVDTNTQNGGEAAVVADRQQVPTLFPLLLWCENRIEARVSTWTAVEVAKKENKTFYDVEIKLKKSGMSSTSDEDVDDDLVWTVRKRFRQFRALFKSLEKLGLLFTTDQPIIFPLKASKRRPLKGLSRDYDVKVLLWLFLLDITLINLISTVNRECHRFGWVS